MRYFIALVLEGENERRFTVLRQIVADIADSYKALLLPPHITLRVPFETDQDIEPLCQSLESYASEASSYSIKSTDIGYFEHRVCYLDVEQTDTMNTMTHDLYRITSEHLQQMLSESTRWRPPHFHLTLAYSDLTEEGYERIRQAGSKLVIPELVIPVNSISLLRRDPDRWVIERRFALEK